MTKVFLLALSLLASSLSATMIGPTHSDSAAGRALCDRVTASEHCRAEHAGPRARTMAERIIDKAEKEREANEPAMRSRRDFAARVRNLRSKISEFKRRHVVSQYEIDVARDDIALLRDHEGLGLEFGEVSRGRRGGAAINMHKFPLAYAPWRAYVDEDKKHAQLRMLDRIADTVDLVERALRKKERDPDLVISDAIALLSIADNLGDDMIAGQRAAAAHRLLSSILPLDHDTRMRAAHHSRVLEQVRERGRARRPRISDDEDKITMRRSRPSTAPLRRSHSAHFGSPRKPLSKPPRQAW